MSVSIDGFICDRDGGIGFTAPSEELFAFHLERVRELDLHVCGRRLYETMLPWETDPAMRSSDLYSAFAEVWTALPKVVFSHTLARVEGNARLAEAPLADEIAPAGASGLAVEIGGAGLAGAAFELGLVDDLRLFRCPVVLGGGTPYLPAVTEEVAFAMVETATFGSVLYERYARSV